MTDVPDMMRALRVNALLPDLAGLALERVAVPQPGPGEVLVRVRAAGLGFPDLLMTHGGYQAKPTLPFTPGGDIAGEVVLTGAGVDQFAPGDAVVVTQLGGGFAEYAVCAAGALRRKPARLSFAQASAFGSAYLTAWVALVRRARLEPGEWVLVHGAAGGVGLAAVDLARALGARVIAASASADKLALVQRDYAPDAIVDSAPGFRDRVKAITGGGADVIYDPVGGDVFDESTRCIAFDGRLLVIGFTSGRIASLATNIALIKGFSVMGVRAGEYGRRFPDRGAENFAAVWAMADAGQLKPRVHAELPLDRWREAFEMMARREVVGRAVIAP
jgi:NADPH2:quinone reductase